MFHYCYRMCYWHSVVQPFDSTAISCCVSVVTIINNQPACLTTSTFEDQLGRERANDKQLVLHLILRLRLYNHHMQNSHKQTCNNPCLNVIYCALVMMHSSRVKISRLLCNLFMSPVQCLKLAWLSIQMFNPLNFTAIRQFHVPAYINKLCYVHMVQSVSYLLTADTRSVSVKCNSNCIIIWNAPLPQNLSEVILTDNNWTEWFSTAVL